MKNPFIYAEERISNRSDTFHAGDWVEVRSQDEVLATLDERGCLDNLPFMPEMLENCGKRFLVYKRADKTCDTITGIYYSRRMHNTVHLANLRCDGSAHGGCDTTCLLFWKEAWLRKVNVNEIIENTTSTINGAKGNTRCSIEDINKTTRVNTTESQGGEEIYSCQATELLKASFPLPWWDIRQYWREFASGNIDLKEMAKLLSIGLLNGIVSIRGFGRIFYLTTGYRRYPFMNNRLMVNSNTPYETLNLQPGEVVQVREIDEILKTLKEWKNRGLWFDPSGEMLKYCGKKMKVLKRVRKVIDEKTGRLLTLKNDSVILEGAICCGHYSPDRLLCPRSLYSFWREIWLQRVDPGGDK
jgi:hypothetical protein